MTGQELLKLMDANVFRSAVMDTVINEFVPPADAFVLTNAFLPFKLIDKDRMVDLINHGAFGRTYPVNLAAQHRHITIPGFEYREHTAGNWRESVEYGEDVLQKAVNPAMPTERWGEGLATTALNLLDLRLNVLIEYITSKMLIDGYYSEARHGVNYTYNPNIPPKYYVDVTSSPPWTSAGTWATAANAKPITDIIEATRLATRYGISVEAAYMSLKTALDFVNAADTQNKIKAAEMLVLRGNDPAFMVKTLTGVNCIIDERLYAEETTFSAASAVGDTTLDVVDGTEFTTGDIVTLRNSAGQEEDRTITKSGNTFTVTATTYAYAIGDRVTVYKRFLPDNYFILKGRLDDRSAPNNWLSTPSLIKANDWKNPLPGRYTWTYFQTKVPYKLEVGAGISGGPKVSRCTWMRVKTTA